jgi:hypothetical protein
VVGGGRCVECSVEADGTVCAVLFDVPQAKKPEQRPYATFGCVARDHRLPFGERKREIFGSPVTDRYRARALARQQGWTPSTWNLIASSEERKWERFASRVTDHRGKGGHKGCGRGPRTA